VVVRHGANLAVEDDSGALQHCVTRRNIGHPVCGDRVIWQPAGDGTGVVTALLPRDNVLSRPDFSGRDKPLAANLSLLAVVIAPKPPPSGYLVDQYLVAAELIGVRALLVAGKMDLLDDAEAQSEFLADLAHYEAIGYPVCPISTKGEPGLDALTRHLADETAILLGQSGVGKSSLVNRLLPDQEVQIGRLSKATGLGRHTTSAATCYRLPGGRAAHRLPGGTQLPAGQSDPGGTRTRFPGPRTAARPLSIPGLSTPERARLRRPRRGGERGDRRASRRELPASAAAAGAVC
jgi:ribosome biogenesis GTPase